MIGTEQVDLRVSSSAMTPICVVLSSATAGIVTPAANCALVALFTSGDAPLQSAVL